MASKTCRDAARAFELEIAGTILPAISLILNDDSNGIENDAALKLAAADTNFRANSSSFEKVI
jgi:hypothetical protein